MLLHCRIDCVNWSVKVIAGDAHAHEDAHDKEYGRVGQLMK